MKSTFVLLYFVNSFMFSLFSTYAFDVRGVFILPFANLLLPRFFFAFVLVGFVWPKKNVFIFFFCFRQPGQQKSVKKKGKKRATKNKT